MGCGGHRGKRSRALIQSRSGKRLKRTEEWFVAGASCCHCWYPSEKGPGGDEEGNNGHFFYFFFLSCFQSQNC